MVQKTGIIVQKKNYTLRTWQTEDAASLAPVSYTHLTLPTKA